MGRLIREFCLPLVPVIGALAMALLVPGCKKVSAPTTSQVAADRTAVLGENQLSDEFKRVRDRFLGIAKRDDINPLLDDLAKQIDSPGAPADLVFSGSLMLLIRDFESITYRVKALVEHKNNNAVHSTLATWVMGLASARSAYLPTKQADAVFRYLTEPAEAGPEPQPIDTMALIQAHLDGFGFNPQSAYSLEAAYRRIAAIRLDPAKPLVFDNIIAYGDGSFQDDLRRYYEVGDAELQATLASIQMSLHGIRVFNAYNLDDLPLIAKELGLIVGLDGWLNGGDIEGMTAFRKTQVVRNHPTFWTLKGETGQPAMTAALGHMTEAAKHADLAWAAARKRDSVSNDKLMAFDQFFYNPQRQSLSSVPNEKASTQLLAMMRGITSVKSQITPESITVNIPAFYNSPPSDLKDLLPIAFNGGGDTTKRYVTRGGKTFRDYLWGSPDGWNAEKYKPYIEVPAGGDVRVASRILLQSWGGWIGTPLVALAL